MHREFTILGLNRQQLGYAERMEHGDWLYIYNNQRDLLFATRHWDEKARQMIFDATGESNKLLTPVKQDDLVPHYGHKVKTRRGWYRHTRYTLPSGTPLQGFIQDKSENNRSESLTFHDSGCVLGTDLTWLLKQNGYRPA